MRITKQLTRRSCWHNRVVHFRRRPRNSVRGGASGFQCTASKIRTSLPADHCRPIRSFKSEGAEKGAAILSTFALGQSTKRETRRHRNHGTRFSLYSWIRDPYSRLGQDPAERGQSLELRAWGFAREC
jgi:hypothetical protein